MSEKIPRHLLNLIAEGEKISTEFKESQTSLPDSLFETICAFLNRNGGHIFLGIKNNGSIVGVSDKHIETMKKDFANLCNNPQKITPTVYLKINEYELNKSKILHIYVHESSDVHKTKNKIFDRNEDGDYEVTFNKEDALEFEKFIVDNLNITYWNEYIMDDKIVFNFKNNNNITKRYILSSQNNDEILRMCRSYAELDFSNVHQMYLDTPFYSDKIEGVIFYD